MIQFTCWIKSENDKTQWCTFFINLYVDVEFKKILEFYVEIKSPSCSDQSDFLRLVDSVPRGLERRIINNIIQ